MRSWAPVEAALSRALGAPVRVLSARGAGGSSLHGAARLETDRGPFFVKHGATGDARFTAEAAGLRALAQSETSLVVPEPITAEDGLGPGEVGFIVTRFLEPGRRTEGFEEALGRGLAAVHRTGAATFGFHVDTYCGSTRQPNDPSPSWTEFYRERRLRVQLQLLTDQGKLGASERRSFERLLGRLGDHLAASEPPALIHGDLWAGNVLAAEDGRPALIDPACAFADREAELGMTTLFGGFSSRFYDAYAEAFPLAPGWRERNPLYQLWHVANHATIFGGGYVEDTMRIVRAWA